MTIEQEEAFYDFLDNTSGPFTLEDITAAVMNGRRYGRKGESSFWNSRFKAIIIPKTAKIFPDLSREIAAMLDVRRAAFRTEPDTWLSWRGFFEGLPFVICPTRPELLNGILIPGHRCIPFANPELYPHEYSFRWHGKEVPGTSSEGPPEDFYPYYSVFGEEYAPQYIARDNEENEEAYNEDPYEEPPEVSIHTLDMRGIYRESAFVPGDRFIVETVSWKDGVFNLRKCGKEEWPPVALAEWQKAAEEGFARSFEKLGPGATTYEQVGYAYWYGGKRMRELPAWSLEEFLYEKTEEVDTVPYGIETRFWYAGKEIADTPGLDMSGAPQNRSPVEEMLYRREIPLSEYAINTYVRDAVWQGEETSARLIKRIIPQLKKIDDPDGRLLAAYIDKVMPAIREKYSPFRDRPIGQIRQRAAELHTAVIELAYRLKGDFRAGDWLPRHTFIILSQIQLHAASLLADFDTGDAPPDSELEAIDNSLDSMIETYEEIKEKIDEALDNFRRNNLTLVRFDDDENDVSSEWRSIQISIGGTDIWRRINVPLWLTMDELHRVIQAAFGWQGQQSWRFFVQSGREPIKLLTAKDKLRAVVGKGDLLYEYGVRWTIRIMVFAQDRDFRNKKGLIRCGAGEGAAPPEDLDGPVRYKKLLYSMEMGSDAEQRAARAALGDAFNPEEFDMAACSKRLAALGLSPNVTNGDDGDADGDES